MKHLDIDKKRHLIKAFTWRIIGSIDTVILSWIITGQLSFGLKIGAVELFTKILLYYLHERAWIRVKFGINHKRDKPNSNFQS